MQFREEKQQISVKLALVTELCPLYIPNPLYLHAVSSTAKSGNERLLQPIDPKPIEGAGRVISLATESP